jgi:hypothetical protein
MVLASKREKGNMATRTDPEDGNHVSRVVVSKKT